MTQLNETNSHLVANLLVFDTEDNSRSVQMKDGTSMIIGNDSTCGLKLDGPDVASKHCVLRLESGVLGVCDWYSDTGTFINEMRIENESTLGSGDELRIGGFRIKAVFGHETSAPKPAPTPEPGDESQPQEESSDGPPQDHSEPHHSESPLMTSLTDSSTACDCSETIDQLQNRLKQADGEIRQLRDELQYQISLAESGESSDAYQLQDAHNDEVELLRVEVAHLQTELADRDRELSELLDGADFGNAPAEVVDSSETEKLVDRLDQLLDELQAADQRVLSLEELLRCSEEASQAEREERLQLESWVEEIESRVVEREHEWTSRQEHLQENIAEVTRQRDAAQQRLAQSMHHGDDTSNDAQQHLEQLQRDNNQLNEQLAQARQSLAEQQNNPSPSSGGDDTASSDELRQQMRQNELELAKERAEIARHRSELVKMREEIERKASNIDNQDENPDVRIRALRDHLREIHEEEKEEKRQRSLSARISRLWQRLDG